MNSKPKKSAPQPTGTHRQPQSSSDRPAMPQKPISPANSPGGHGVSRPMAKPTKTLTAQPKTVQRTTSLIAKTTEQQRQSNEQQNEQRIESTRPVERSNEQPSVETPTNERVAETMVEQPSVAEVANFIESVRGFGGAFEAPLAAAKIEPASMSQNQFETEPAFADTTSWQADQAEAKRRSANRGNRSARRVSAVQQAA